MQTEAERAHTEFMQNFWISQAWMKWQIAQAGKCPQDCPHKEERAA